MTTDTPRLPLYSGSVDNCICAPSLRAEGWVARTCPEHDPLSSRGDLYWGPSL